MNIISAVKRDALDLCVDCGNTDIRVLEFDHLPSNKKLFGISGNRVGIARLKEEIKKCDVVCANCHRIRTVERRQVCWRK